MTDANPEDQIGSGASSSSAVSRKSGVRRVNNRPMYILFGVLGTFLLAMIMVATDRAAKQDEPVKSPKEKGGNTKMFAEVIAGDHMDGMIEPVMPPGVPDVTSPEQPPVLIARPTDRDGPPAPPRATSQPERAPDQPDRTQEELQRLQGQLTRLRDQLQRTQGTEQQDMHAQRVYLAKQELLEQAIAAETSVQFSAPRSIGSTQSRGTLARDGSAFTQPELAASLSNDPLAAYNARLAQIRAAGLVGGGGSAGTRSGLPIRTDAAPAGNGTERPSFNSISSNDPWQLGSKPGAPGSPYGLRAGFVVPGTLISGINSDLPGTIMAQVSQNVYDTATGRYLLIPQGSRLVGTYSSDVVFGQSRVFVAWQRIVFPDGKALDIGSMPGADGAGYAGFHDQVNNHYLRIFASAILMSGITAGISFSQGQNDSDDSSDDSPTVSGELTRALGQQLGEVSAQLIERNLSIAPTLEIRPGYRFNIIVVKDMTFSEPYRAFDY